MAVNNHRRLRRSGRPRGWRPGRRGPGFVIQQHQARNDYYELGLEIDGVLVSWAIPRGPAVNPHKRRMARRTDDHPLDDGTDAGIVWDRGTYANKTGHEMTTCLGRGHLSFLLTGEKLHGGYALTRVREGNDETWLLLKHRDDVTDAANRRNG